MSSHNPLPAALVERLFSRFIAIYGTQKIAPMWAGADLDEVKAVWAQALGRFEPATIGAGIQALIDSASQWPPNLPEFDLDSIIDEPGWRARWLPAVVAWAAVLAELVVRVST